MIKFGFMPGGSYFSESMNYICSHLKRLGYDCVELPAGVICPRNNSMARLEEIVQAPRYLGMEISEAVVQRDVVLLDENARRDNIAYTLECIEAYSKLGIKTVNVFTGPVPWLDRPVIVGETISEGSAWDMVFDAFRAFTSAAEKYSMALALENVWGMLCNDFFTARYLIDSINSPMLGVNYDPSHDVVAGHFDTGWIVRQWGNKIKHVHLKDAAGIGRKGQFVFPLLGEGRVDWKGFFTALNEIGYDGACSVEFESFDYLANILDGNMEEAARISMETINNYFKKLL